MSDPLFIGGASMPRSGHHFLHRILMSYLGDSFGYCSYYSPLEYDFFPNCCGQIPCSKYKQTDLSVFFQKSHDFDLSDPADYADLNLVQIRLPIARLYSNFDLHVRNHPNNNKLQNFRQFAIREFYYYVAFWQKWVVSRAPKTLVMTYESLKASPLDEVSRILTFIGLDVDMGALQEVIHEQSKSRGGTSKYRPRRVKEHEFYDQAWVKNYNRRIRNACAGYDDLFLSN